MAHKPRMKKANILFMAFLLADSWFARVITSASPLALQEIPAQLVFIKYLYTAFLIISYKPLILSCQLNASSIAKASVLKHIWSSYLLNSPYSIMIVREKVLWIRQE